MTIVPLSLYLKGSWIKLTIGVGRGKKLHDKRQDEKQKNLKKEINSVLRRQKNYLVLIKLSIQTY